MRSLERFLSVIVVMTAATFSAMAQKPELIVQTSHTSFVSSLAFSPNGRIFASGSDDRTIRLWDVQSGKELRTLTGHSQSVQSIVFLSDGETLASASLDKTIKLWNVVNGQEIGTLTGHTDGIWSIACSPDGRTLASGGGDNDIKLWDIATRKEWKSLKGHSGQVLSVAFSTDGKLLASASWDNTVKLWDIATSQELRSLRGHTEYLYSVEFSPDGKTLISGSSRNDDQTVKMWNMETGEEFRTLKDSDSVTLSPDGTVLAGSNGKTIKLLSVDTGLELRSLEGHLYLVEELKFAPDGRTLASVSREDHVIKLWDLQTGQQLQSFSGHTSYVTSITLTPNDSKLIVGNDDDSLKLWNLKGEEVLEPFAGASGYVYSLTLSPDGETLAARDFKRNLKLWTVSTGEVLLTIRNQDRSYGGMLFLFSPDSKALASVSNGRITLWDIETGKAIQSLSEQEDSISSLVFSPDSRLLASGSFDTTVKLWDVQTGKQLISLNGHSGFIQSLAFAPDGKTLASGSNDATIRLWDLATGKVLRILLGHKDEVESLSFSAEGNILASGSNDGTAKIWEVATGKELRSYEFDSPDLIRELLPKVPTFFQPRHGERGKEPDEFSYFAHMRDRQLITTDQRLQIRIGEHGKTNILEFGTGKLLASLIALDQNDWAVVMPDGLFDGSSNAWKQLIWRLDNNTFNWVPIEAFFNEFYYPGLLNEIVAGRQPKSPKNNLSAVDIRQPQVRITRVGRQAVIQNPPSQPQTANEALGDRKVEVTLEITDNSKTPSGYIQPKSSGAQDVRLFRNGSLVKVWRGDVLKGESSAKLEATLPIVAEENLLTAYAFNHDNIKSSDATLTVIGADSLKRKGAAYVLAVGVDKYANSQYNLKYAVADALDFAAELKRQQAKLSNYERVEVISLNDREATKANILKAFTHLSNKIQPEDALFIFFAGHGTAQQNRFYLIPHDLGYMGTRTQLRSPGLRTILSHSISDKELERAVEGIDAGQVLLVIDACNSGQALEAEEKRRGPMNSKGLAQLAYEKGMYILTAAQSYQAANEAERYGHGFLTYALVEEGLKTNAADREPKDGLVMLREWLNFATERVPQMQQEVLDKQKKQGRQLDRIKFAEADSESERSLQRPRVFYRRETELHPLVVARP